MLVTLAVLNELTSMLSRLEQPLNMSLMSVTQLVEKWLKSRFFKLEQPANIEAMLDT